MKDSPLSDLFIKASIDNENQLMAFYDSIWQNCRDTGRSTRAYFIIYQGGTINHGTYVPGQFSQPSAGSEYNTACTTGMASAHLRILIHEFLNKDTDIVPQEAPLIILDRKSAVCMENNGKNTNHTSNISKRVHFVSNSENFKMHKIDWCEGGL